MLVVQDCHWGGHLVDAVLALMHIFVWLQAPLILIERIPEPQPQQEC